MRSPWAAGAAVVNPMLRDLAPDAHFARTARHDPHDRPCSVGQIIVDAHDRAARCTATCMAAAKAPSATDRTRVIA